MSAPKLEINEVFTPRSHVVNPAMYINRPNLEKELERAVNGGLHSILTGENGSPQSGQLIISPSKAFSPTIGRLHFGQSKRISSGLLFISRFS